MSTDQTGYKKPPVKNQFKKGQSGNPKGKPKGSKNLKTTFEEVLRQPVSIRQGEGIKTVPTQQAICMVLAKKAMQGDIKAIGMMFKAVENFQSLSPVAAKTGSEAGEPSSFAWTEEDESLRPFFEHLKNERSESSLFKEGLPHSSSQSKIPDDNDDGS